VVGGSEVMKEDLGRRKHEQELLCVRPEGNMIYALGTERTCVFSAGGEKRAAGSSRAGASEGRSERRMGDGMGQSALRAGKKNAAPEGNYEQQCVILGLVMDERVHLPGESGKRRAQRERGVGRTSS